MSRSKHAKDRRHYIMSRIKENDSIRIDDVAEMFDCRPSTIRNDLKYLRDLAIDVYSRRGVIQAKKSHLANIVREISFPSQYKDAGVSILSYFSTVIEEKYPDTEATVTISQQGEMVTLKIESDEGELEKIEKTLNDYGRVVSGTMRPDLLLGNTLATLNLNNKLELAKTELRLKEQSFNMLYEEQKSRVNSLEVQVVELRKIIGSQLNTVQNLSDNLIALASDKEMPKAIVKAVETIAELSKEKFSDANKNELIEALDVVKKNDELAFNMIINSVTSFATSISANIATPWFISVINSLPLPR